MKEPRKLHPTRDVGTLPAGLSVFMFDMAPERSTVAARPVVDLHAQSFFAARAAFVREYPGRPVRLLAVNGKPVLP